MAVFICQGCGAEHAQWDGKCPQCGTSETIRLSQATDRMVDKIIKGKFKIVRKLGQGGMGAVYLAEQVGIGHRVALKFLKSEFSSDPEVARRFLNEAKSYARVAHPNAVALHDFGQDEEGNLFIAMEFCEGVDLKKVIAEQGHLPLAEAVEIVLQAADVLANAHAKGVIHRDLKPENIMIRRGMRGVHAKVLDFGIARLMDAGTRLTVAGSIAGTPRYMSPEQVEGKEVDLRADIYSLGIVLFEAITGRQPFDGGTIAEILRKQVVEPMPHLAEVASEFDYAEIDKVIQKATAKNREQRWPDLLTFASALSQALPTQAHLQMPALQRTGLSAVNVGAANATPNPASLSGLAQPGTLPGDEASSATVVRAPSHPGTSSGAATLGDATAGLTGAGTATQGPASSTMPHGATTTAPTTPGTKAEQAWAGTRPGTSTTPGAEALVAPKSKTPMVVGGLVVLVAVVGGVLYATNRPTEGKAGPANPPAVQVEPPRVTPPPQAAVDAGLASPTPSPNGTGVGADDLKKVLREEAARSALSQARTEFEVGRLDAAETFLKGVEDGTESATEAQTLRQKITDIREAMKQANAHRAQGRCEAALKLYQKALDLSPRYEEAKAGKAFCSQAAVSPTME